MKIQIESTTQIVQMKGIPCRLWEGKSETGVKVMCWIATISVPENEDLHQFQNELRELTEPSFEAVKLSLRLVI